jgi:spore coat protein U-like protein
MTYRRLLAQALAILLIIWPHASYADASCRINSVSSVNFGTYDVFSSLANNNGVGSITIKCQGSASAFVALSSGKSNSYVSRQMISGRNTLSYNLYTSAARNIIWGDGTGGSSTMVVNKNDNATLSLFGQIPAGQDAAIGSYTDNITTVVNF